MTIRVALNHQSEYTFDRLVGVSPHLVRLRPAPHSRTPVTAYSLRVEPGEHFLNWQQDPQSNWQARVVFPKKARRLFFEVDLVAEMTVINPFDYFLEEKAQHYPFAYDPALAEELAPFRRTYGEATPRFAERVARVDRSRQATNDFLVSLNRELEKEIDYLIRLEPGVQTLEETLEKGSGSCRDSAWLLVMMLRHLGLAARFVSGYLIQLKPDKAALEGPSGPAEDFCDLHAWAEVYLPGAGWVGLDPTSGLFAGEGHIPLAATPEPTSAAPITGFVDKCESELRFSMKVTRVHEDPRVTKPYTEEQWERIRELGEEVDRRIVAQGLKLTMGGEPTFVSVDDMEGDEWNTVAVGPTKRRLAGDLFVRMRDRFAPGGLLHYGQGKWYPGEQLPRWALSCYWRKDGEPIWRNDALIARDGSGYGHDNALAREFIARICRVLAVKEEHSLPAYEDVYYYLWREGRLPVNTDPFDAKLEDPEERDRLRRVFDQGLSHTVGYCLPIMKGFDGWEGPWRSGNWVFRDARMHLIPGDSPMGLRLPLASLPWVPEDRRASLDPLDPTARRGPLPRYSFELGPGGPPVAEQSLPDDADGVVRTALCAEPREGMLHLFMPPLRKVEHYLELVAAIESVAEQMAVPVRIEGYLPPFDSRINHFKVTPDPGVIEVNIHPAQNWQELVEITEGIYEDAHHARLGTEKFQLDGRHVGTGGGNHIVIGGPTPLESPILQRPDLLKSLVGYWINHPSLSYLFSGLFIGPTSQAPRVDEGRHDFVHELRIAFAELEKGRQPRPWLVDRVLRNILTDLTGNTHRAEFCIDKLYSPDSANGRLGLLELRAYEMPPHERMSLTQALLLRSFLSRFAEEPYDEPLVAWGTSLHDRFMLPWFLWHDFRQVIRETRDHGIPLEEEWFLPHREFRCPAYGTVVVDGVEMELRQALEPWNVLGEEGVVGGTARYVDSSVERVQILVRGLTETRYSVTCNGRRVPLHPTGTQGEYVAGIRYRAWQPPNCLHPTIGVHSPLVFDLHDRWNRRSVGGFTYHVKHPGGLAYERFPVNAAEAETRRFSRFFRFGHTPGEGGELPPEDTNPAFPMTLDLRRPPRFRV